jgi:hypothetical protein
VSGHDPRPVRQNDVASPLAGLWAGELPPVGGDLVRSLTYRQTYTPTLSDDRPARRQLTADAPDLLRMAAGGAWALVSVTAAGSVLLLTIVVAVRLVGVLT